MSFVPSAWRLPIGVIVLCGCLIGIVGSFIGVWLGGKLYDSYGTYDVVWWLSVALGIAAALVHLPIREAPAPRLATAAAA